MTNHPTITIAPLSVPGAMSQAAWRCIQQADALFLQTDQSPCARPVLDAGLAYRSMDDLYASGGRPGGRVGHSPAARRGLWHMRPLRPAAGPAGFRHDPLRRL